MIKLIQSCFFKNFLKFFLVQSVVFSVMIAVSEKELIVIAHALQVSVEDIKERVGSYGEIKDPKNIVKAFQKKIDKRGFRKITLLSEVMLDCPEIQYIKVHDEQFFEYEPFSISKYPELQPNKGLYSETFILKIPNGQVFSDHGYIRVGGNTIVEDVLPSYRTKNFYNKHLNLYQKELFTGVKKIKGKVAVATSSWPGVYGHWLFTILTRLALLEMKDVEYDWLYVPCYRNFMKETLALWGVDTSKIIEPYGDFYAIEADELIVPSFTMLRKPEKDQYVFPYIPFELFYKEWGLALKEIIPSFDNSHEGFVIDIPEKTSLDKIWFSCSPLCAVYYKKELVDYVRNKYLRLLSDQKTTFSKRVFISRKDAPWRDMKNEDAIFELFKQKGFERYILSQMPYLDQVALFHNAEIVVGTHGSGIPNIAYCRPGTRVVEIFQKRLDSCHCYLAQILGLQYQCIATCENKGDIGGFCSTDIPVNIIEKFIAEQHYWD